MKLTQKVKYITCGTLVGAMFMTALPAVASQATKSISATYNNIKIIVDGRQVTTNSNNEPFIYNGTTYLPVRAVGEAVGKQVTWDGATNTVYLGDNPISNNGQYLIDVCPPYQGANIYQSTEMSGKTYPKAFSIYYGRPALVNLDGQYSTLEFDLGHRDASYDRDSTVNIYLDDNLVKTITLAEGKLPEHYTIPLNYALQLKIENVKSGNTLAFANCIVK